MTFGKWLDTFIEEKGIDTEQMVTAAGPSGENHIPVGVIAEHMKIAPKQEQDAIKDVLVRIDFQNGDVLHFFKHLAGALAV